MPVLVPACPDVPGEKGEVAATVERPPTPEQAAAIGAPALVFVSAGAGTGKTSVLVERFVRAIEAGVDVVSILVITYTDRAAAELRSRIRRRLAELGRPELTRELDGAWISTLIAVPYDHAAMAALALEHARPDWACALSTGRMP